MLTSSWSADTPDPLRMEGMVAVITGAGSAGARAIALGYAREGADLFLQEFPGRENAVNEVALSASQIGHRVEVGIYDVADRNAVVAMTEQVIKHFGRVDVLVNMASGPDTHGVIFELSEETWDRAFAAGLKSYFLTCQLIGKEMARRGGGKIINLTSIVGRLGSGGAIPSSAMCGARDAMMRAMAHALGAYGVRVNNLAHGRQVAHGGTQAMITERLRRLPLGRVGIEDDLVGPAIFLATSASTFVTGTVLYSDGGYTSAGVTDDEHRPKQVPYVGD